MVLGFNVHHAHFAQGHGAGLVRANDIRGTQGFRGKELAHQGSFLEDALHANGENHRNLNHQALGNGRNRNCHGDGEHLGKGVLIEHPDPEEQPGEREHAEPEPPAERIKPQLQRRAHLVRLLDQGSDGAHFSGSACCGYHKAAVAFGNHGSGKHHIMPVRKEELSRERPLRLCHSLALARKRRFARLEVLGSQEPAVRGHLVPCREHHQVPAGELG